MHRRGQQPERFSVHPSRQHLPCVLEADQELELGARETARGLPLASGIRLQQATRGVASSLRCLRLFAKDASQRKDRLREVVDRYASSCAPRQTGAGCHAICHLSGRSSSKRCAARWLPAALRPSWALYISSAAPPLATAYEDLSNRGQRTTEPCLNAQHYIVQSQGVTAI